MEPWAKFSTGSMVQIQAEASAVTGTSVSPPKNGSRQPLKRGQEETHRQSHMHNAAVAMIFFFQ